MLDRIDYAKTVNIDWEFMEKLFRFIDFIHRKVTTFKLIKAKAAQTEHNNAETKNERDSNSGTDNDDAETKNNGGGSDNKDDQQLLSEDDNKDDEQLSSEEDQYEQRDKDSDVDEESVEFLEVLSVGLWHVVSQLPQIPNEDSKFAYGLKMTYDAKVRGPMPNKCLYTLTTTRPQMPPKKYFLWHPAKQYPEQQKNPLPARPPQSARKTCASRAPRMRARAPVAHYTKKKYPIISIDDDE